MVAYSACGGPSVSRAINRVRLHVRSRPVYLPIILVNGQMKSGFRRRLLSLVYSILRVRILNALIRVPLKPLLPVLPKSIGDKFPVSGNVHLALPGLKPLVFKTDGRDSIASRIYWRGFHGHEPETLLLYLQLLKRSNVVVDVGAGTGIFTLIAGAESKDRQVYSFEPVPEIFDSLRENIDANGLENVTAVQGCVTNYQGEITLYVDDSLALPFTTSILEGYRHASGTIVAPAMTLDAYVEENHIEKLDLLKIDAEGSDVTVLEGATQVLRNQQPIIICEVLYTHTDKPLQDILDQTDYQYFYITDEGLLPRKEIKGDHNYVFRNYLFVPKSKVTSELSGITIAS